MKKSFNKFFTGLLIVASALMFFGCNLFPEEDKALTVDFAVSGTTTKTVKMTASSSNQKGNEVYVVYTIDGSIPTVKMELGVSPNELDRADEEKIRKYVNYGTAEFIKSGDSITITESTEINAIAFYIISTDIKPLKTGPVSTKEIKIASSITPDSITDNAANQTGKLTFNLAKSGNSMSTHYFDTSDSPFKYSYKGTEYDHCYYQIQFSYKGAGKGNWYLYVRQIGNSKPIGNADAGTNFLAYGVYTGACFNSASLTAADGELTLNTLKGNQFGKVNVTNNSFDLTITKDTADAQGNIITKGNISQAIDDAK